MSPTKPQDKGAHRARSRSRDDTQGSQDIGESEASILPLQADVNVADDGAQVAVKVYYGKDRGVRPKPPPTATLFDSAEGHKRLVIKLHPYSCLLRVDWLDGELVGVRIDRAFPEQPDTAPSSRRRVFKMRQTETALVLEQEPTLVPARMDFSETGTPDLVEVDRSGPAGRSDSSNNKTAVTFDWHDGALTGVRVKGEFQGQIDPDGTLIYRVLKVKHRKNDVGLSLEPSTDPAMVERLEASGITSVRDRDHEYKFVYHSREEKHRAERLFTKEPGTIKWLSRTLRADDVFFDIGANIGAYTIFAGYRIGDAGFVYGFEPHLPNAVSLLNNIEINALQDRVRMISIPLSNQDAFDQFQYFSLNPSRAHSQLGRSDFRGTRFKPAATELKYGCRLDSLIAQGLLPAPTVVKIDVDGFESEVVAGMTTLLRSAHPPRSIQIEVGAETYDDIVGRMAKAGYRIVARHWTQSDQVRVDADPRAQLPCNVIFERL
jgi:FkbM family methyltransferase